MSRTFEGLSMISVHRLVLVAGACAGLFAFSGSSLAQSDMKFGPAPSARADMPQVRASVPETLGYYRMPALRGDTLLFVAEGDLWKVSLAEASKGTPAKATRLTSHEGIEELPAISPDGKTIAFVGSYEGPVEIYSMPIEGGLPTRRSWDGGSRINFVGWKDDQTILWSTGANTTMPRSRTNMVNIKTGARDVIPLDQCDDAEFVSANEMVFTRLPMQGSNTDRYKGGTAQNLWRFTMPGKDASNAVAMGWAKGSEATALTPDYPGTSKRPHFWNSESGPRVVFTTDRSGHMNLWSMKLDGTDLKQHTQHEDMDIGMTSFGGAGNTAVYQLGADLWMHDLATGKGSKLNIELTSDVDHTRERWVKKPMDAMSSFAISPDGDRVVITARGKVFVFPVKQGRSLEADTREAIRYRDAKFSSDGKTIIAISDESGELELTQLPANGVGDVKQLTKDAATVRWQNKPSPDGKKIAHTDKLQRLWIFDVESATNTLVEENKSENLDWLSWSPDSQWLAYTSPAANLFTQVKLYNVSTKQTLEATSDRYDSYSPTWSKDGKFLYFLSDRTLRSVVGSPWGPRAPEPFFDKQTRIYQLTLKKGERNPFQADDEVWTVEKKKQEDAKKEEERKKEEEKKKAEGEAKTDDKKDEKKEDKKDEKKDAVVIDADGLMARIDIVPVPAGNYSNLFAGENTLYWHSFDAGSEANTLKVLKITNQKPEAKTVAGGIRASLISQDRKKLLIHSGESLYVVDAGDGETKLDDKAMVDLSGWTLSVMPRDEWRQMYIDAWRLLRDYFYDRNMHGVDWNAVLKKYMPLVERVRDRRELADLLAQMTGELSALHHFVYGGDIRTGDDQITFGFLGADMVVDPDAGGWKVRRLYEADPDEPQLRSPLLEPSVSLKPGDVITMINGVNVMSVPNPASLLRTTANKQVLLHVKSPAVGDVAASERDVIVKPLGAGDDANLRYRSWQVERRRMVEQLGGGDIGYVHLRAMGNENFSEFARDFYPVYDRKGLIIDVRDNRGGNIDSWLLSRLQRKVWMFWNQHAGRANSWNMQFAFRGHMCCLINERTASDGEAFAEGFKRLGLGKVIGTRTWGGEIWLSSSNNVVDGGIATAGEFGVFDEKGNWLVEGHGVEPDIVVDNLPHETFMGKDRQIEAAVEHLKKEIAAKPIEIPPVPKTPDKSFKK
ncbi:MAG: S41 family peptidase [Phycisphaerales bacterium]